MVQQYECTQNLKAVTISPRPPVGRRSTCVCLFLCGAADHCISLRIAQPQRPGGGLRRRE